MPEPTTTEHRGAAWVLVVGGLIVFGIRSIRLALRFAASESHP